MSTTAEKTSARDRLLAAATELFYEEGVHTVGIDRVIERAGVAKASLYNTFGSKEELVRAYLEERHNARMNRLLAAVERVSTPREKLLAVFDAQNEIISLPNFRGCAFANASAEEHRPGAISEVSAKTRDWTRAYLAQLATDAGVKDADTLAEQLVMLYDGAITSARMDDNKQAAMHAKAIASVLVDAAL